MKNTSAYNKSLACEEVMVVALNALGNQSGGEAKYAELHLLTSNTAWQKSQPGNFVMLRPIERNSQPVPLAWGHDLIWGRAFSICRVEKMPEGTTKIIVFMQIIGRGTPSLLGLAPGDKVLMWGPLGNTFSVEPSTPTLVLAGGLGVAPFVGYALNHPAPMNINLQFGHKVPLSCYPLSNLPSQVKFAAHFEQSSKDLHIFLDILKHHINDYAAQNGLVLACGPKPFLKFIHGVALEAGARAELSLETQMACGSGACLGCTVKAGPRFKPIPPTVAAGEWPIQVCLHGPVFKADEISFD